MRLFSFIPAPIALTLLVACLFGCQSAVGKGAAQTPSKSPAGGDWQGTLDVPGAKLRMVFHISAGAGGALKATLDSPDQGVFGIPCDRCVYANGNLTVGSSAIQGAFEGKLDATKGEIAGSWKQGGTSFPLTVKRGKTAVAANRPQEPKPPFPYTAREVTYENTRDKVTLAGTLTVPTGAGPFPAALLITGSGAQNRDEELMGHKPFFVLADDLTRRGIAVLRVDDRGVGGSTGSMEKATSQDFAEDVKYGIAYLKTVKEIDPKRIGLLGHSEGGLIAPMVASQDPTVAFIVLMAGPGVNGEQILYKQGELIARAAGATDAMVASSRKVQEGMFSALKEEKDLAAAEKRIRKQVVDQIAALPEAARKSPQASPAAIEAQVKAVVSPWFRFFLAYDPVPALRRVRCPVLAVNGEKDLQVPPAQNLPAIREALKAGGNKDFQAVELPGLNHLFQTCKTGSLAEYTRIEETISPTALKTIGDWIEAHTRAR